MGDRAMVVNAACVNQIDGSPNIVGGGGGCRFLLQCESCINVGTPNDPVGFFSTWLLPCWLSDNSICNCSTNALVLTGHAVWGY